MAYNQFCPISLAMEILGEKWTLLVIREVLLGSRRFNDFQRGLPGISPTILTKRLNSLEEEGLIVKKRIKGQRGFEYFATEACEELYPVIEQMGIWGMQWARHKITDDYFNLELLMLYLERSIQPENLIGSSTVIKFNFQDVKEFAQWWIVVEDEDVDVCVHDPGKDVDIYFNSGVRTMAEIWMGDISYREAIKNKKLEMLGSKNLIKNVENWLKPSIFADLQPATEII